LLSQNTTTNDPSSGRNGMKELNEIQRQTYNFMKEVVRKKE